MGFIQPSAAPPRGASCPLWGAAPTAGPGASSDGSQSLERPGQYEGVILEEQLDTDKDSILLLRQMVITALASKARQHRGFHSFLEHPRDPAECSRAPAAAKCSSVWATRVYEEWTKEVKHCQIHLDQCRLGQMARKSTTFSTDLPLHHWQGLQCNHSEHLKSLEMTSRDLSRYPPTLMAGLAAAIIQSIPNTGHPPASRSDRPLLIGTPLPDDDFG